MIDPNLITAGGGTGSIEGGQLEALRKALDTGGYGTDMSTLTGGAALRVQSLDRTMQTTIQENKHFRLFNRLPKPKPSAVVDEWTEQNQVGGFLGGSTNTETGAISAATGSYARRVGQVKYMMTLRQVSFVQTLQDAIADSMAIEHANGALQLLTDAEYLSFEGDSSVVATEFDGIAAQLKQGVAQGVVDPANIVDAQASALTSVTSLNTAAAQIAGYGNFGTPTDIFMSVQAQADFDSDLDPAFRVAIDGTPHSVNIGTPVVGIRTSHGNIATQPDVFVRGGEQKTPFELRYSAQASVQAGLKPAAVSGAAAADSASMFASAQAGNYYYLVTGINAAGQSTGLLSAQVAVAAGQSVTLSITGSAANQETGYVIYRSRLNGTNALSDLREMLRVGRTSVAAGAVTTYVDQNRDIPGTCNAYVLNLSTAATAITWRQLLPMTKFPLYPTNAAVLPWAQLLFGYLRISKRKHHVVIKNILPKGETWRPFNV